MAERSNLRAGDLVEILDAASILRALDAQGTIGHMPFMPEMLQYCGRRLRVSKVAHKTCDTAYKTGARRLDDCYHLEDLRCDGSAHGGCQATCLLFWKGAWLRKIDPALATEPAPGPRPAHPADLKRLCGATRLPAPEGATARYSCQATRLFEASRPLRWWDPRQYVRDLRSRNVPLGLLLRVLVLSWFRALTRLGIGFRLSVWLYQKMHLVLMGKPISVGGGLVPANASTPTGRLDLAPGERVVVKRHIEIRKTLGPSNKNRGLWFDQEYVPFCGSEQRVSHRVDRLLDERTGEMLEMKNPCVVLEGVKCDAYYSVGRLFCPRAITAYWREVWLERAPVPREDSGRQP